MICMSIGYGSTGSSRVSHGITTGLVGQLFCVILPRQQESCSLQSQRLPKTRMMDCMMWFLPRCPTQLQHDWGGRREGGEGPGGVKKRKNPRIPKHAASCNCGSSGLQRVTCTKMFFVFCSGEAPRWQNKLCVLKFCSWHVQQANCVFMWSMLARQPHTKNINIW